MNKKSEMGVGTLIVFIAMLLVAAVAAGVLIQTVGSLQERATTTGQQAQEQIVTNAEVVEISATDGRTNALTDFHQRMRLSPGSEPMQLDEVVLTFTTEDETATLQYRGVESICEQDNAEGYNTWMTEEYDNVTDETVPLVNDLDDDGEDDEMYVSNEIGEGGLVINFSGSGYDVVEEEEEGEEVPVGNDTETFAYVTVEFLNTTEELAENVTIEPYRQGEGYFSVIYEQTGDNHVPGTFQDGDVARLCYESPGEVGESESVRINFVPRAGTSTTTEFTTPDIISTQRVYLYP